ncbi:MAG: 7-cyano-7-deazaguanine synthase [Candidatus Aenigmatarchaeota archaeon]
MTEEDILKRVEIGQKNYEENMKAIEEILIKERGYVFDKPLKEDVVVLLSGGLDSAVMVDMIIKEWDSRVHPLYFRRGARAEPYEESAFDYFVGFYKERYPDNIVEPKKMEYSVPPKDLKRNIPEERLKSVGLPMRNSTMQNLAVMYAVTLEDVRTVLTGSVGEDQLTPEALPELGLLSLRAQTLNTCINMGEWYWQITSPLVETTLEGRPIYKISLIEYAVENDIPLEKTRSCFSEYEVADGTCPACERRLKAFGHLKREDPLKYKVV